MKPEKDAKSEACFHVPWEVHTGGAAPEPGPFGLNSFSQILRTRRRGDLPNITGPVGARPGAGIPVSSLPRLFFTGQQVMQIMAQATINQSMMYFPIHDISRYVLKT